MREQTSFLIGQDGLKLFFRKWLPDEPRGSMVIVHGMNEHCGRYDHVARFFADQGLAVYALDHRGHGQSEGTRCYINRFEDYIEDLRLCVEQAKEYGTPLMIGHSMGGLIAFRYGLAYPDTISALVLSSPFFRAKVEVDAMTRLMAPLLSALTPRLQLNVPFAPDAVCRDPEVVQKYATDPLVGKKTTPRWFIESSRAALACHHGLCAGMKLPVLFLQAGDDVVVDPAATRTIFEQVPSARKAFKLYPGMYHEIFNDPERDQVFLDILKWAKEQELMPS